MLSLMYFSLAIDLFKRMVTENHEERYTASEALNHPWITRRLDDPVPLSVSEKILLFDKM